MARLTVMGIGLVGLLALAGTGLGAGCKTAKEEAKTFKRCGGGRSCKSPNVCIRVGATLEGICVYPCTREADCPKPFRCTGGYRLSGKGGHYCRRPSVAAGGDCSRIQDGCKPAHRCFKNRCVRECAKSTDCPDETQRCLQVVDTTRSSGTATKDLYRGCLEAKQTHGQPCTAVGPFCARQHICYHDACIRTCADDKGCAKGFVCDGAFYKGKDALKNRSKGAAPDVRYCRRAGGENAACDLLAGKTCARGLFCLSHRCRSITRAPVGKPCQEQRGIFCVKTASCFGGKCRTQCKIDRDCPRAGRKHGKCQLRTIRKKKQGLCF